MPTGRDVVIRLRGEIGDFQAKMVAAGKSVGAVSDKMTGAEKESVKFRRGLSDVADTAGKIGAVAAVGLGAVVAASANFDQAMSNVQAATHETASNMESLREAAIQAGADTAFSASEAAAGIENLAKAGVSTEAILGGGLSGALDLAAAGTMEVADAAEAAAGAMAQFNLDGSQVPHIADLLAAGAGKAQGEVSDMVQALKQSGTVASQTGLTIEETAGTLAAFAEQSLLGSDAGTSFKTMLQRLSAPVGAAAKEMSRLGLSAYDANGNFIGMAEFAGQLRSKLEGMTDQQRQATLTTIFGSDAVRAASIIYKNGADGIQDWIDATNDSGYAAETAAIKLDNLKGDWEELTGSIETALIGAGDGSQGILRGMVQGATDVVNAFNDLPPAMKNVTTGMLAVTAITGGGLWFGAKVIQGISNTRSALSDLGVTSDKVKGKLGSLSKGLGIASLALGGLAIGDAIQRQSDEALPGLEALTEQLLSLADAATTSTLASEFDSLGDSISRLSDRNWAVKLNDSIAGAIGFGAGQSFREATAEIEALDTALARLAQSGSADVAADALDNLIESQGLSASEAEKLRDLLPQYGEALVGIENDAKLAGDASGDAAGDFADLADAANDGTAAVDGFTDALDGFNAAISQRGDRRDYRDALREFNDALKEAPENMRRGSEAWDEMEGKLDAIAGSALAVAEDLQGVDRINFLAQARRRFVEAATAMGIPKKAAQDLATELGLLDKKDPRVQVTVETAQATGAVADIKAMLDGLDGKVARTFVRTILQGPQGYPSGVAAPKYATGGYISGPGSGTSDDIPAWLSNGEYVIKAAAVAKYGTSLFDSLNAMRYASGGYVAGRDYRAQTTQTTTSTTNNYYAQGGPVEIAGQLRIPGIGFAEIRGVVESVLNDHEAFAGTLRRAT